MRDQSSLLPEKIRLAYPSVWSDLDMPAGTSMPTPWYEVDTSLSTVAGSVVGLAVGTQGCTGFTYTIRSLAPALFTTSGGATPTNSAALQALAEKISTDWYSWKCLSNYDRAINGIVAHAQDGISDVEWCYEAGYCRTRACAWPGDDGPQELQHVDRLDPTLPPGFYWAKTDSSGILAATSPTQMTVSSGVVTFYKENATGLLAVWNDPYGNPITRKAWNKAPGGPVPGTTIVGVTIDLPVKKVIVTFLAC